MPRSAIGIGMLIGLLVGGVAGAAVGIWLAGSAPFLGHLPFVLGLFPAFFGMICGAVVGAVYSIAVNLIGRRPTPPDGPDADYRGVADPPGRPCGRQHGPGVLLPRYLSVAGRAVSTLSVERRPAVQTHGTFRALGLARALVGRHARGAIQEGCAGDQVMTEEEWLVASRPLKLLGSIRDRLTDRKLRLFACACCRRVWHLLPDPANRDLVAAVEDRPDGTRDDPVLWAAIEASSRREHEWTDDNGYLAVKYLGRSYYKVRPLESAVVAAAKLDQRVRETGDTATEGAAQAGLVRDIFGNSFQPVAFDPRWRTADTVGLARDIYDERAFDRLPLLADALMDAGCTDEQVIGHCRSEGPHVRGCWVVDMVLAKE
jgi:hypothetical protein